MNTSAKFRDYNSFQKIGVILLLVGGALTLAKVFNMINANHFLENDLPNYIFGVGGLLVLSPYIIRRIKAKGISNNVIFFPVVLFTSFGTIAQDYSKQIEAFAQSFEAKNTDALQPYMSPELQFGDIPKKNSPAIMKNIVTNLPKLNSMNIIASEEGKAKVGYDFVGLGKSESFIHFDTDGKITKIQLVEDLIQQEAEARRQQQGIQLPTPGALGEKFLPSKVEFPSGDGLLINANRYGVATEKPVILLLHQAGYNRIEYADIAPKLNEMGYTSLAVDLRSGGPFAGKPNKTQSKAIEKGLSTEMVDAQQDIAAAIDYLHSKYKKNIILWGSSFSSSLALLEGVDNPKVKAIIGFSPGDYFGDAKPSLSTVFPKIQKPFFVTSSKAEADALKGLIGGIALKNKQQQFVPKGSGFHGSKALWEGQEGAGEYWTAVKEFLNNLN